MKLSANRTELHSVCKKLCKVATDSKLKEVYSGILLEADAENLEIKLTAMNVEVSICFVVSAAVRESGSMVINASLLEGMLSLLGESVVKIEKVGVSEVKLSSGKASYNVGFLPADSYPKILLPNETVTAKISNIADLVSNTAFITSNDKGVSQFNCMKLEVIGTAARIIATDGIRLMICQKNQETKNNSISLLISSHSLRLLSSVIDSEETLTISVENRRVMFKTDTMTFATYISQNSFVDAQSVLKGISKCCEAITDSDALYSALDSANVVADSGDFMQIVFENNHIKIACDGEHGSVSLAVPANVLIPTSSDGFYYNPKKLLQSISAMTGTICLITDNHGILIVKDGENVLLMTPVLQAAVLRQKEKREQEPVKKEKKKPTKAKTKTKKTAKAA